MDNPALAAVFERAADQVQRCLSHSGAYLAATDQVIVLQGEGLAPCIGIQPRCCAVTALRSARRPKCAEQLAAEVTPPDHVLVVVTVGPHAGFCAVSVVTVPPAPVFPLAAGKA